MKTIEWGGHTYELVECPDCHSTRKRCMRPSGHEASAWHKSREVLFDQVNAEELAKANSEWEAAQ